MTAICGDAQANVDFYVGVLGLRLVKKTVNFDDPGTYHLYYGDGLGNPGSILTFFAWPGAYAGRHGLGQVTTTALAVPEGSLDWWAERLAQHGIAAGERQTRFGHEVLPFLDPEGIGLELVARADVPEGAAWPESPVPAKYAIRRMDGVTLTVARREATETMLTGVLGFTLVGEEGDRVRFTAAGQGESGSIADIVVAPGAPRGSLGVGVVHHIAWRTPDDATQLLWQQRVHDVGRSVSPVMDRDYFHSIYFHEPGGVLFEIATVPPGFTVDEPAESLGTNLCLPQWLEKDRPAIAAKLPALHSPMDLAEAG